jgi:hypothetical protein
MSGCALRRWGPGTPCNRDADTPASKEMAVALAKMQTERDLQDKMWTQQEDKKTLTIENGPSRAPTRNGEKKTKS